METTEKHKSQKLRKVIPYVGAVLFIVLIVTLVLAAAPQNFPTILYPSEVRDYMGENLSSIGDVRENAIAGTQYLNNTNYSLKIAGLVDNPLKLSYEDVVSDFPSHQKVVTIYCVEGWNAKILWEGVLITDLLEAANANMSAPVAIFRASDGYSTALPIGYLVEKNIILAYKMNNLTMPVERGFPFELVAETQAGYKWIKWVTEIEVSDNAEYRGYWESRGYPNNATVP